MEAGLKAREVDWGLRRAPLERLLSRGFSARAMRPHISFYARTPAKGP